MCVCIVMSQHVMYSKIYKKKFNQIPDMKAKIEEPQSKVNANKSFTK